MFICEIGDIKSSVTTTERTTIQVDKATLPTLVGQTILDRYLILSHLGQGATSSVYRAHDTLAGSLEVAIKLFPLSVKENQRARKRFIRELTSLAKLKNDHIIQLYEPVVTEELIGFSMELVRGATLRERIAQGLSPEECKTIVYQLLIGLDYIHSKGFIHRDLKPSNILVREDGVVRIADLGLATLIGEKLADEPINMRPGDVTVTGKFVGTPIYAAPEQLMGGDVTFNSDLFSVGVILFETLTGQLPHRSNDLSELARLKLIQPRIKDINSEYSEELDQLLHSLLSGETKTRVPSAREAANKLQRISMLEKKEPKERRRILKEIYDSLKRLKSLVFSSKYLHQPPLSVSLMPALLALAIITLITILTLLSDPEEAQDIQKKLRVIAPSVENSRSEVITNPKTPPPIK